MYCEWNTKSWVRAKGVVRKRDANFRYGHLIGWNSRNRSNPASPANIDKVIAVSRSRCRMVNCDLRMISKRTYRKRNLIHLDTCQSIYIPSMFQSRALSWRSFDGVLATAVPHAPNMEQWPFLPKSGTLHLFFSIWFCQSYVSSPIMWILSNV